MKNRIIVPTDFTGAAGRAIGQAIVIARKSGSTLTLFHVLDHKDASADAAGKQLNEEAERIRRQEGIACEVMIREGSIFEVIPLAVCEKDYDLMVIGTHGLQGIRQKFFGADILQLGAKIPIPVLVVQEESALVESFDRIVLPVGSHENFQQAVDTCVLFAGIFNTEIHLYSIHKPGYEWTKQLLANIAEATQTFETLGIRMIRVKEEQEGFSLGYASQTLNYAQSVGASAVLIMSGASPEYLYLAKTHKESILLNEFHMPVLCSGGESGL